MIGRLRSIAICFALICSPIVQVAAQQSGQPQTSPQSPPQSRPAPRSPQSPAQAPQNRKPPAPSDQGSAPSPAGQGALQVLDRGWRVACQSPASDRNQLICSVVFEAFRDSGQRLLAIELNRDAAGQRVLVTTPLGVNLFSPVEIVIDQGPPVRATYQTCQTGGCVALAPRGVDAAALQRASELEIRFESAGQRIGVPVPLAGFSAALKRAE